MTIKSIDYVASPTCSLFHHSPAFVRGIRGPVGSGKTVALIMEMWRLASIQNIQPDPLSDNDLGVRRGRFVLVRNTYPELKTTTLKTFEDWFGDISDIKYGTPISAVTKGYDDEGNRIEAEFWFIAMDSEKDVKKLKSLEVTAIGLNEASELPESVLKMCRTRAGRYPAKKDGGAVHPCIAMDTNSPDEDHWWYRLAEDEKPDGHEFFDQPPALLKIIVDDRVDAYRFIANPKAENIENLPDGYNYYFRQIPGSTMDWIKVFVLNEYGSTSHGKPVYPEYQDGVHCPKGGVDYLPGLRLYVGMDFGLTPAAVLFQESAMGQIRFIDEITTTLEEYGMGVRQFITSKLKPFMSENYPGVMIRIWGDPSGGTGSEADAELTCFRVLAEEGYYAEPASKNNIFRPRREALSKPMGTMVDRGMPGFVISHKCIVCRKGLRGKYQYEKVKTALLEEYKTQPKKNIFSHVVEAGMYGVQGLRGSIANQLPSHVKPLRKRGGKMRACV